VITGEGRLDASSLSGKTVVGVARLCRELGAVCVAIVGSVGEGAERALDEGLSKYVVLREGAMSVEESMRRAPELLARAAENLVRSDLSAG
jgi:glycerate kinase